MRTEVRAPARSRRDRAQRNNLQPQPLSSFRTHHSSFQTFIVAVYTPSRYILRINGGRMPYRWLPETVATLYAELLDQAIQAEAAGAAGTVPTGSFISKTIGGRTYWYLQRSEGHRKRQVYLGPDSPSLRRWMDRVRHDRRDAAPDRENRRRLCAMLASGGAATEPAAVVKVLQLLSESGIFRLGGVLVGTLAFRTYANVLGVRFERGATRTEDIDIAHDPVIGIALAREDAPTDLEQTLTGAGMGFPPIPVFHHGEPSTSFKIRGRDLRVDLLTPMRGRESSAPVHLHAYRVSAQPVRFLEYLLHD
ncbi:MAG TPA: hypothetical protein ENK19_07335, partial [Acidobacteria bacterium]|nr:hypothetical protein [Acidobacteriota bacterium]